MVERIIWVISMIGIKLFYFPLNRRKIKSHILKWPIDKYIPFIPVFIIPYIFFYPLLYLGGILTAGSRPIEQLRTYGTSYLIMAAISFLFFIFWPTSVEEYQVKGTGFFREQIKLLYKHDARLNAFPSLHVSTSILSIYFLSSWYPSLTWLLLVMGILVLVSTVTIRQHHLPDILGGILVTCISITTGILLSGLLR